MSGESGAWKRQGARSASPPDEAETAKRRGEERQGRRDRRRKEAENEFAAGRAGQECWINHNSAQNAARKRIHHQVELHEIKRVGGHRDQVVVGERSSRYAEAWGGAAVEAGRRFECGRSEIIEASRRTARETELHVGRDGRAIRGRQAPERVQVYGVIARGVEIGDVVAEVNLNESTAAPRSLVIPGT